MKTFNQLNDFERIEIATAFIATQAVINHTHIVEYVLTKAWEDGEAPFHFDDITNSAPYGYCDILMEELTEEERDTKLEFYEYLRDKVVDLMDSCIVDNGSSEEPSLAQNRLDKRYTRYVDTCDELENMSFDNYPEIYQWFLCSDYLIYELEERGQCTLDKQYWGRQCCGQSIVLDCVIQEIAYDYFSSMKVLPNNPTVQSIFNAE